MPCLNDDEPLLDRAALDNTLTGVGADAVPLLMEAFERELRHIEDFIRNAAEKRDWHMLEVKTHALKSAAASFGAMRLSALCKQMEDNAREANDIKTLQHQRTALTNVVAETRTAFGWV